jgi:acetyl-CoA C-acetyltransferase
VPDAVIAGAVRTPIGKFGRGYRDVSAPQLGSIVIKEAVARSGVSPSSVEEVVMGNVISAGMGQAPARQAALAAGLPMSVAAVTVNKVCASGLKAVAMAADAIWAGSAEVVVAGGMENMSRAPYLLQRARFGYRYNHGKLLDSMIVDGLWDAYKGFHMGMTGEIVADRNHITRDEMDAFSLESHRRAAKATQEGRFRDELVPVETPVGAIVEVDEGIRSDTSLEKLAALRPVFKEDGMITAGNASQLSDGASALVLMASDAAESMGVEPLAKVMAYATSGVSPELVMEAPIPAVRKLLRRTEKKIEDFDLFEHNEAYAAATIAVGRELGIPSDKLNVNGGAVALVCTLVEALSPWGIDNLTVPAAAARPSAATPGHRG